MNEVPTLAVPSAEGHTDPIKAIQAACAAGKWTLIAPDGRMWVNDDLLILAAALSATMRGEALPFGQH